MTAPRPTDLIGEALREASDILTARYHQDDPEAATLYQAIEDAGEALLALAHRERMAAQINGTLAAIFAARDEQQMIEQMGEG